MGMEYTPNPVNERRRLIGEVLHILGNALCNSDPAFRCSNPSGPCPACKEHDERTRRAIARIREMGA